MGDIVKQWGIFLFILLVAMPLGAEEEAKDKAPVQAMKVYEKSYDALMENVVNLKTPGYKSFDTVVSSTEKGQIAAEHVTRFTKGTLEQTNGKLDVAIEGDGFFVVQLAGYGGSKRETVKTASGLAYTRDGRFQINKDYELVTMAGGFRVFSQGGPIIIPGLGSDGSGIVEISAKGEIIQNGVVLGILQVVTFDDMSKLERINGSFFRVPPERSDIAPIDVPEVRVRPGFVEASNVDLSRQLVELPLNTKKYDANSKALQILRKASQTAREMGRTQ